MSDGYGGIEKIRELEVQNSMLREENALLNRRVKLEREIANGYARSSGIEYRDKLWEEIKVLKRLSEEVVMDALSMLEQELASELRSRASYKEYFERLKKLYV